MWNISPTKFLDQSPCILNKGLMRKQRGNPGTFSIEFWYWFIARNVRKLVQEAPGAFALVFPFYKNRGKTKNVGSLLCLVVHFCSTTIPAIWFCTCLVVGGSMGEVTIYTYIWIFKASINYWQALPEFSLAAWHSWVMRRPLERCPP